MPDSSEQLAQPVVSVIIEVHHANRYFDEAVNRILKQTLRHFEFIIITTNPDDRIQEYLKDYPQKDKRITLLSYPNLSRVYALNEGIAHATGNFIAFAHAADIAYPERLSVQREYLRHDFDCVAVGCQTLLIDEKGLPLWTNKMPTTAADIEDALLKGEISSIRLANTLFRRGPLLQIHGFNNAYEGAEDYDLFIRLLRLGMLKNTNETLIYERYPAPTQLKTAREIHQQRLDTFRKEHGLGNIPLPTQATETNKTVQYYLMCAKKAEQADHAKTAQQYTITAFLNCPFHPKTWFAMFSQAHSWVKKIFFCSSTNRNKNH